MAAPRRNALEHTVKQEFWSLQPLLQQTAHVPGDIIEIGVYRGRTFLCLAAEAQARGVTAYACDTWRGMPEPTEHDWATDSEGHPTRCEYPRGAMAAARCTFEEVVAEYLGHNPTPGRRPTVMIQQGEAPASLACISNVRLSFAHLDVDLYAPTLACLRWLWPRMSPGGILACHDWFPERRPHRLATVAIVEWMLADNVPLAGMERRTRTAWFVAGWRPERPWPETWK